MRFVPHSSKQYRFILTTKYYFTKWVEANPIKKVTVEQVISFIDQHIITRFGLLSMLICDNFTYFYSNALKDFVVQNGFKLKY